ncbi:MAG: ankyrin repeat domain-containing protein [Gemmatimonadaceae bacterium]
MPDSHTLDALKAHAKQLLTLARAHDNTVITALRKLLPILDNNSDSDFAANIKLADVQHAIAAQRGMKSWAELKRKIESVDPLQVQAERFLHAIREDNKTSAVELLSAHPAIAQYSIHAAAAACDAETVEAFLLRDTTLAYSLASPNWAQPVLYACGTPLHDLNGDKTIGNKRCVQLILDAGGDPNAFVVFNGTEGEAPIPALYFAANLNNVSAVRLLLERGANPNDGESVYHAAERNNRESLELLLAYGAEISEAHERWGNTPLYFIAGHKPFSQWCASSELGMLWLLQHGANPDITSYNGEKNAQLPSRGEAPLHRIASYGKSADVSRMLVEHGATVDLKRGDGKTAYVLAVRTGNSAVAEYLASVGADITALTERDALVGACLLGDAARANELLVANPKLMSTLNAEDRQTLALATEEGRIESVRLMTSLGWDLSAEGAWGGTALHHAAWHGNAEMAELLVKLGAPINFRDTTFGSSPIAWAAHGSVNSRPGHDDDYKAVVDILLQAGATREASYNTWNEAPEQLSSKPVAALLKKRGFSG